MKALFQSLLLIIIDSKVNPNLNLNSLYSKVFINSKTFAIYLDIYCILWYNLFYFTLCLFLVHLSKIADNYIQCETTFK